MRSISRCEVTPTSLRNLRTSMLKRSSSIVASAEKPERNASKLTTALCHCSIPDVAHPIVALAWESVLAERLKPLEINHPQHRPVCTAREHAKSWGAHKVGLNSGLTGRGWAGAETDVAGEAGCGAAARRDDRDRGCSH